MGWLGPRQRYVNGACMMASYLGSIKGMNGNHSLTGGLQALLTTHTLSAKCPCARHCITTRLLLCSKV